MSKRTAAEYLAVSSDDSDGEDFHSFEDDERIHSKNREVGLDNEDEEDDHEEEIEKHDEEEGVEKDEDEEEEEDKKHEESIESMQKEHRKVKKLSGKVLEEHLAKIQRTGVVYISRLPPYMQPFQLRKILARFGEVGRIFMTPEDGNTRSKRIKFGGNRKRNFVEGWAEFVRRKDAKLAAETLNANKIGGRKHSFYHDDILSIKYLPKFKWHNLTEQIVLEQQSRQDKMRAEIAQATRENKAFIANVEKSKKIERRQKRAKQESRDTSGKVAEEAESQEKQPTREPFMRTFEQRQRPKKQDTSDKVAAIINRLF